jgi:hypothetical protein
MEQKVLLRAVAKLSGTGFVCLAAFQGDSMDKKILPEKIECTVTHEGKPVAGLMLHAGLAVEAKNPYSVPFGPTGVDGRAVLEYPALKEWTDQEMEMALMDFRPLAGVFTGVVVASVMTREQIDAALEACEMFKPWFRYPANYADHLRQARQVLGRLGSRARLPLAGTVKPESIRLVLRE